MERREENLFEALEPRVLLSGEGALAQLGLAAVAGMDPLRHEDSALHAPMAAGDVGVAAEAAVEQTSAASADWFAGMELTDLPAVVDAGGDVAAAGGIESDAGAAAPASHVEPDGGDDWATGVPSGLQSEVLVSAELLAATTPADEFSTVAAVATGLAVGVDTPTLWLTETLRGANGPPQTGAGQVLEVSPAGELSGSGVIEGGLINHGLLRPGNSPGVISITTSFTQGPEGVTEIEIGGLSGAGVNPSGHDRVNVTGNVTFNGTVRIELFNGFVPSAGQSFVIFGWTGTRTGQVASWLGTAGIPGKPELAFVPSYDDVARTLTVTVTTTPTIVPVVDAAIQSGLNTLQQVGTALNGIESFVQTIPLVGNQLANVVNAGQGIAQGVTNQINSWLALNPIPRQSAVTAFIEGWDGTTPGGIFQIGIDSVEGIYGASFGWHVKMELTQTLLNQALQDLTGALLGALFNPDPQVTITGSLLLDFTFGYDGSFYIDIDALTARMVVDVNSNVPFSLVIAPSGGPVNLSVLNLGVDLLAEVVATPNASVLTGGRITSTTLTNIGNGTINAADAFDIAKNSTLDATLTVGTQLTGLGVTFLGDVTGIIHSDDLFDGPAPDLTLIVDGTMTVLGQQLTGVFTLRKTAVETIIEASDVSFELTAGAGPAKRRILLVENGSGKFLWMSGDLAGSATLTLTEGPQIPNITIGDTTVTLTLNTSAGAVPVIDGETVNLPAGPYYRVEGNTTIELDVPEAELSGDFLFEPFDPTPALPSSGDELVTVGVANLSFGLGDGTNTLLNVTNGQGVFVFAHDGMLGQTSADVAVTLAALGLNGAFSVRINDRNSAFNQTVRVNGTDVAVNVLAGPYLRVEGTGVELDLFDLTFTGNFSFEQKQTTTGGEKVVTVVVEDATLPLGNATDNILDIDDIDGTFIIRNEGVAGVADASVSVGIPDFGLTGTFGLTLNETNAAVNETVNVFGSDRTVNVPQGPYLKVSGTDLALNLFGMQITADASFEKKTTQNGVEVVVVEATDVDFDFGTNVVSLDDGAAIFVFMNGGVAGQGQIDLRVNAFGGGFVQPVTWDFNDTGVPITDVIPATGGGSPSPSAAAGLHGGSGNQVGKHSIEDAFRQFNLPEGPYNRLSTGGVIPFSITAAGRTQSMQAALVVTLVDGGANPDYATVGVSQFAASIGVGPMALDVSQGTGAFIIKTAGVAGMVEVESVSLTGVPGVSVAAENLRFEFNNTNANVPATVVSVSDNAAEDVTIEFTGPDTYYHNYLAVCGAAEITVAGIALGGNFRVEVSGGDKFKVGASGLHLDFKVGSFTVASFNNGSGAFYIRPGGVAGTATLDFEVGMIALSGNIRLEVNTTGAPQSGTVDVPGPTDVTFNLPTGNYVRVYVDGHLHLGSVALPFQILVKVNTVTNVVEFANFSNPSEILVSVNSSGNISLGPGLNFDDFAAPGPFEYVQMLRQLANWFSVFSSSDVFDIEIPFTGGQTLGDVFNWSQAFVDRVYSRMVSTEIQSASLKTVTTAPQAKNLNNAKFRLKIGEDVTLVNVHGAWTLDNDLNDLIDLFNDAFDDADLEDLVEARVHVNLRGSGADPDDVFVIALKPEAMAQGLTLDMLLPHPTNPTTDWATPDNQLVALGFTGGDGDDDTIDVAGVVTHLQDTSEAFFTALAAELGVPFTYHPASQVYTFDVAHTLDYPINVPFNLGGNIGDLGSATLNGQLTITPRVEFGLKMGFDLAAAEVPRILSASGVPVPANGRISADAHFQIYIDNEITPLILTLPALVTNDNNSIENLAADLNQVFSLTPFRSTTLNQYLYAQKAGTGLAISALNEDYDGDGVLGNSIEDTNGNQTKDPGEDVDGDGFLDRPEDLNGDGNLDKQLGLINRIVIRSLQNDTFATELGFGVEAKDLDGNPATTNDRIFESGSTSRPRGLFIEDVHLEAGLRVETPVPISGSLRFGFVEVSTSGGLVQTRNFENTDWNDIRVEIDLEDQTTGEDRFYISDLFGGLSSVNIANLFPTPHFEGSLLAKLSNISVSGLGPLALPAGAEIALWIPDITDLDFNSEAYNGSNTGIFITYPDLGHLMSFNGLGFTAIIKALNSIADSLSQMSEFSFLNEKLPLIDVSINDLVDYATQFADIVDSVATQPASTMQSMVTKLKEQIDDLFNLDPSILTVSIDNNGFTTFPTATGGNATTKPSALLNVGGPKNALRFEAPTTGTTYNGARIRITGDSSITDSSARASYNTTTKELLIKINGGVTTANAIISAVAAIPGHAWTATAHNADAGNDGTGTITTTALKFGFNFLTAYANTFPLQLDLAKLVDLIADDETPVKEFLEAATAFIQVTGSGVLTVNASASLKLEFGFDLTNPANIKPFFYDTTAVELTAKVLGTNINLEASLGSVVGIAVKNGTVTLDADGDPTTGAGNGDKGARIRLGLKEEPNGDHRYYFSENLFSLNNFSLVMEGGASARLPIFAPTPNLPLGTEADDNGDGFPDNQLVLDVPDLVRLFMNDKADGNTAIVKFAGLNNDFQVVSNVHNNFEVVFVHNPTIGTPAEPASASFSGNTLTVTIRSGVTTANQALQKIQGVPSFAGSAKTADDDNSTSTTTNTGGGALRKLTIAAPDFSQLFANLDLCAVIDSSAGLLLDGLDSFLGSLEDGLNDIIGGTDLPIIGDGLGGAANFISDFRNGLLKDLRDAIDSAGSASAAIENALKNVFWDLLGPPGLDILAKFDDGGALDPSLGASQLDVSLDCENGLVVNLRLKKTVALLDTTQNPIDFDIGVPGFGLEVDGNIQVSIGFDLKFGFGINKEDGFFFNSSAPSSNPELRIYFEVRIPGLSATGELLFLQLEVSDNPDRPSYFTGQFVVDLKDPNSDGKLTFAEMSSSGLDFEDIIEANLEAIADVNLKLIGSFGGNTAFPRIIVDFHLGWQWDLQDGATDPDIRFENIYLDLGTFISDFLGPVLSEIRKVTEPVQPLIDVVTARLPILSDLAGEKITLLTLAEIFGLLEPSTIDFIEGVLEVITLINDIEGLGEGSILIPFGSFILGEDESGQRTSVQPTNSLSDIDFGSVFSNATSAGASQTYVNQASSFQGKVDSLSNFSIPIFDNPSELFQIFTGGAVRLVEWRMPTFLFEFSYTQKIPIYPPLYAQFGGKVGAKIDIGFGYDTYGIQKFIASEEKNFIDILDGFYVIDFDRNGVEQNELTLYGELFAGVSINLGIAEVGVRGGLYVEVGFDLNDVNDDGRVRVSEIITLVQIDPRCLFNIHGEIGIFLEAFLKVDLFFFSIEEEWEFGRFTLFEFDLGCPEPVLAEQSGSTLTLNIGSRAEQREEIDTKDTAETFVVTHIGGSAGNETVEVQWGNFTKEFTGVGLVKVEDAGQGDDHLDFRGVLSPVDVNGGVGNDTIFLSDGSGSKAYGGKGNDTITASAEDTATLTEIWGDEGNDILIGGTTAITIHGGEDRDTITGTGQNDSLYGDGGDDDITGGDLDDTIEGGDGNDVIYGNAGNDNLKGGKGNDRLYGHRGDDTIDGETGADEIWGSSGNDRLVGGDGDDWINGHGGIDLIIGDKMTAVVGTLAAIPTNGIEVQGLSGSGDDFLIGGGGIDVIFGGDGNDFLYGGNFMNSGDSEPIEEDQNDFFDGGAGDDTIFGDDAQGRSGDRNTGISIKSDIWFDWNQNNIREPDEKGFAGVEVTLYRFSDSKKIGTEKTDANGAFEFMGLDKDKFYLRFSLPTGMTFSTAYATGATGPEEKKDDSDATHLFATYAETDEFLMDFDETEDSVSVGYKGEAKISIGDVSVEEGDTGQAMAIFQVKLSGPEGFPIEIEYETSPLSATHQKGDYTYTEGVLTLNPGQLEGQIAIPVLGDVTYERAEQFRLNIVRAQLMSPVPANRTVTDGDIRATIIDDDPVPAISIKDFTPIPGVTPEGALATFRVSLSNPSKYGITVEYRTDAPSTLLGLVPQYPATPSGLPDPDFSNNPGAILTFPAGVTERVVTVQLLDDPWDEYDEHFYVDLFNPVNASIDDGRAFGIIPDDDLPVSVYIVPATPKSALEPLTTVVTEDDVLSKYVGFEVHLSGRSLKDITVTYGTAPGTAVSSVPLSGGALKDFEATPDSKQPDHIQKLVFAPGEMTPKTFTVEVSPDNLVEDPDPLTPGTQPEEFYVNIVSAVNANVVETPSANRSNHVVVEIIDDDTAADVDYGPWSIRLTTDKYYVQEPKLDTAYAEVTVARTPGSSHAIAVLTTEDGTATSGADYAAQFRALIVFGENEYVKTVLVPVFADGTVEGIETVKLHLQNPTGGPVKAGPAAAELCILDGDTPELLISAPVYKDFGFFKIYGVLEGTGGGSTLAKFTFSLKNGAVAGPGGVVVDYETVSLTARAVEDFTAVTGNNVQVIAPGASTGFLNVAVKRDSKAELTEQFALRVSDVKGALLQPKNSVAKNPIYDDDLKEVQGLVFYDSNRNGFRDDGEKGIADVDVVLGWVEGGEAKTKSLKTDNNGIYKWPVALGPISVIVDGESVTSPNQNFIELIFGSGVYETTTDNETQAVEFEGIVGISPFEDIGYGKTFTFDFPVGTKDVGRGGTDDTIFGGPHDDTIDAGAGDDHVVGGHWMTATDQYVPVNTGNYTAKVTVTNDPDNPELIASDGPLHNIYDKGPIFGVSTAGLGLDGKISGEIWLDTIANNSQDPSEAFYLGEVIVHLFDCAGNPVNSVSTTNGKYEFTGIFVQAAPSEYIVQFELPKHYEFVAQGGGGNTNNDAFTDGRTGKVTISSGTPTAAHIDAGLRSVNNEPATGPGKIEFAEPSFSVVETKGFVEISLIRGDSTAARSVVVVTKPVSASAPANYLAVTRLLTFALGETEEYTTIPIVDSGMGICDTKSFMVLLYDVTGRLLDRAPVTILGNGAGALTDDDVIDGGDDWDILLGDSGNIPAGVWPSSGSISAIVYAGGPGKDQMQGGEGNDFVNGQLQNDHVDGGQSIDIVWGGLGKDTLIAGFGDDVIDGMSGRDTVISSRDVPVIILDGTKLSATLIHRRGLDDLSTFSLKSVEVAKLFGGYAGNKLQLKSWDGSAHLFGDNGTDSVAVELDMDLIVADATAAEALLYLAIHGYSKQAAISLGNGETYHLSSIENVSLKGGPAANKFDASAYSKDLTFEGVGGDDTLIGGSGDDRFVFLTDDPLGKDTLTGNGGIDTIDFTGSFDDVILDLSQLAPTIQSANANLKLVLEDEFENLTGGDGSDTLTGNSLGNVLIGGPGNDSLIGKQGNERYVFDTDQPWGSEAITENIADPGFDTIDFSGSVLLPIQLNLALQGSPQVVNANLVLTVNGEGFEEVFGGAKDDTIRGNTNKNFLHGGPGNDLLDGKSGDDRLDGGPGNDDLDGGPGNDRIQESADTQFILTDHALTRGTGENDHLSSIEIAILIGGPGANQFDVSGWTGTGGVHGGLGGFDTLVAATDTDHTLTNAQLARTGLGTLVIGAIDHAKLSGGAGDNIIDASAFTGTTFLSGGPGKDTLKGGQGIDWISGGVGDDKLSGNKGGDYLDGGGGSDKLVEERDTLYFVLQDDRLVTDLTAADGDEEEDTLVSLESADLTGGPGFNTFDVSGWTRGLVEAKGLGGTDAVKISLQTLTDPLIAAGSVMIDDFNISFTGSTAGVNLDSIEFALVEGSEKPDTLNAAAFSGMVWLQGLGGDDTLYSSRGTSILDGGEGDDRFVLAPGGLADLDAIRGGAGFDTIDYRAFVTGIATDLSKVLLLQVVQVGEQSLFLFAEDIEGLVGGDGNDLLVGNSLANRITGGEGVDTIQGKGGQDTIVETRDADFMLSNAALDVDGEIDALNSIEIAHLTGGTSGNTIDASAFSGQTVLNGGDGADVLTGGFGSNRLIGGAGDDVLEGGPAFDVFEFDTDVVLGTDKIFDAGGLDGVDFAGTTTLGVKFDASDTNPQVVNANLTVTLIGASLIDILIGGAQADVLRGNALDNYISGGLGDDQIDGRLGNNMVYEIRVPKPDEPQDIDVALENTELRINDETDALVSIQLATIGTGAGNDHIDASKFTAGRVSLLSGAGVDVLIGSPNNDLLNGGDGVDELYGGEGNDNMFGGLGADLLFGGEGDDDLRGGEGSDRYVFDKSVSQGTDRIFENNTEGPLDTLIGAGLSGIQVNLQAVGPVPIHSSLNLEIFLVGTPGAIEVSLP